MSSAVLIDLSIAVCLAGDLHPQILEKRQTFYSHMLEVGPLLRKYTLTGAPLWEKAIVTLMFGIWKRIIRKGLSLTTFDASIALNSIERVFDHVESVIGSDRPFLSGQSPGTADVVFASLAAPVILPPQFGAPVPAVEELPEDSTGVSGQERRTTCVEIV